MKKYVLLLMLAFGMLGSGCYKNPSPPLSYSIDSVAYAYVSNNSYATLPFNVKFLTGNSEESVWLTLEGLPAHVTMAQDTITGIPNFVASFRLFANNATLGYYPVTLVSHSASTGTRRFNFILGIVVPSCATSMAGNYSGSNACASSNFSYSSTASYAGTDSINIVNFGGYGTITTTGVKLICSTDSLVVPSQNIGNGVTVSGSGHFTANSMVIRYIALNTPGGFNDTCTAVLSR